MTSLTEGSVCYNSSCSDTTEADSVPYTSPDSSQTADPSPYKRAKFATIPTLHDICSEIKSSSATDPNYFKESCKRECAKQTELLKMMVNHKKQKWKKNAKKICTPAMCRCSENGVWGHFQGDECQGM